MNRDIALFTEHTLKVGNHKFPIPRLIADVGDDAISRFLEFFAATIRNKNTREAYARAVRDFLCWCDVVGVADLNAITPIIVATYVEQLTGDKSAPTVKQHLAALRSSSTGWSDGRLSRAIPPPMSAVRNTHRFRAKRRC